LKKIVTNFTQTFLLISFLNILGGCYLLPTSTCEQLCSNLNNFSEPPNNVLQVLTNINNFKLASVERIPVRATLFSASMTFTYVLGFLRYLLTSAVTDPSQTAKGSEFVLAIILASRCPLTALITYTSNKKKI
jgi:hypothetical protein